MNEGWLVRTGGKTRPTYELGSKRQLQATYHLPGIDEHQVWLKDFEPFLQLAPNAAQICTHGFTEILNNANDHSGGSTVTALVTQDADYVQMAIVDDGLGLFKRITDALGLPDRRWAILELSKGKLTTDPDHHSGEGIFFTSKMFIRANDLQYEHNAAGTVWDWLQELDDAVPGTGVYMLLRMDTTRTSRQVFDEFADSQETFEFDKTIVPVRLARLGNENLVSRSQAKRLIVRFDQFRRVILDFEGAPEIGQAFADELFRVFANGHPQVLLTTVNTVPSVEQMIRRVTGTASDPQKSQ